MSSPRPYQWGEVGEGEIETRLKKLDDRPRNQFPLSRFLWHFRLVIKVIGNAAYRQRS